MAVPVRSAMYFDSPDSPFFSRVPLMSRPLGKHKVLRSNKVFLDALRAYIDRYSPKQHPPTSELLQADREKQKLHLRPRSRSHGVPHSPPPPPSLKKPSSEKTSVERRRQSATSSRSLPQAHTTPTQKTPMFPAISKSSPNNIYKPPPPDDAQIIPLEQYFAGAVDEGKPLCESMMREYIRAAMEKCVSEDDKRLVQDQLSVADEDSHEYSHFCRTKPSPLVGAGDEARAAYLENHRMSHLRKALCETPEGEKPSIEKDKQFAVKYFCFFALPRNHKHRLKRHKRRSVSPSELEIRYGHRPFTVLSMRSN